MASGPAGHGSTKRNLIPLGIDFETYYDRDYSLSKLTTAEYVLDNRFEIIGVGLILGGALPVWFSGTLEYLRGILSRIPWDRTRVIAHNAIFDGSVLEWRLGFKPAAYACTMMAARPFVAPFTGRANLDTVMQHLGIGKKGTAVHNFAGRRRESFTPIELKEYGDYCCNDCWGSVQAHERFATMLPDDEFELIDLTIKKFTRPKLLIDRNAVATRLSNIQTEKQYLLDRLAKQGISKTKLTSRPQFAALLEARGVEIPKKISPANGLETFAFSKQDAPFMELLTHDDEWVRDLVEARLKFSSNMEETRLMRLASLAGLTTESLLPVPLLFYGAHTGRFSGMDKINLQNLPRIKFLSDGKTPDPDSGWLRRSIVAPRGYVLIAADLSNIEARIVATLAQQWDMVEAFRTGSDLYSSFASRIYGRPINKKDDPDERFVGKTCILGLGYGMGWLKFWKQMILAKRKDIDQRRATEIVYLYRETYRHIPQLWTELGQLLSRTRDPSAMFVWGPLTFLHQRIVLPNGMPIIYPDLRLTTDGLVFTNYRQGSSGTPNGLWGGAITENVVQALARIVLTRAELKLARAGLRAVLQVHDELVFCVPERFASACRKAIDLALTAPVDFLPRLPVACEIGVGQSYAECK